MRSICLLRHRSDLLQLFCREFNVRGSEVLFKVLWPAVVKSTAIDVPIKIDTYLELRRARDRNNVLALPQEPRQRNLTGARVVPFANLLESVSEFDDIWEVLVRVAKFETGVLVHGTLCVRIMRHA